MSFKLGMLSKNEARKILENANLPGIVNRNIKYSMYNKAERMKTITESKDNNDRAVAAAIEIQRQWRGHNARCKLYEILHSKTSAMSVECSTRYLKSAERMSEVRTPSPKPPHSTPRPQELAHIKAKYNQYLEQNKDNTPTCMNISEFCAYVIQRWWRKQCRKPRHKRLGYPSAPPPTTNGETSPILSSPTHEETPEEQTIGIRVESREDSRTGSSNIDRHDAARVIQRNWRKHIDTQVYKYYRDLINFKTRGDPALMLKCINPREADLLDSAAGVHIKFRLAGEKFPPNIYYKIFTHRNIADIGAFAPRDYTHADNKRLPLNLVHNKGPQTKPGVLHCYERWENNGWRLVSDRVVERIDQDPVVFESTQTTTMFHHHKMVRRQDLEKRRKQKKIEWMKKMYKQGMLRAKEAQDSETQNIIETVAKGMVNAAETRGNEAVEDWEVDELLEWTNGLNFDEYLVDWKEFATSAGSEYLSQLKYLPDDPFSFNINTEQTCQ